MGSYSSLASLAVEISADIGKLRSDFGEANSVAKQQFGQMERTVTTSMTNIENSAKRAGQAVLASLGAIGTIEIGKRLAGVADEYANISAKIKLVTDSQREFAKTQREVYDIAQRTFTSMDSVAMMVGRTTRALKGMGETGKDALSNSLKLADMTAKGLAISGASAEEASSSVKQLTQALASNRLAGDEFRSFMENAPRLSMALADALGVNVGQLRKLSMEGRLTTEIVTKGLLSQKEVIDKEFSSVPLTVGRAWQQLENDVIQYVGAGAQATGISLDLAHAIQYVGQHLSDVVRLIEAGGILVLQRQFGDIAGSVAAWGARMGEAAAMTQAYAINAAKDAEATAAEAAAHQASADAAVNAAKAKVAETAATADFIAAVQAEQLAMMKGIETKAADVVALAEMTSAEAALAAVEAERTAVVTDMAAVGRLNAANMAEQATAAEALGAAEAELAAAQTAQAAAAERAAAANAAATAASGGAMTGIKSLGSSLLAFVGGPVGLTLGALALMAVGFYKLHDSVNSAQVGADDLIKKYNDMAAQFKTSAMKPIELINTSELEIDKRLVDDIANSTKALNQLKSQGPGLGGAGMGNNGTANAITQLQNHIAESTAKLNELRVASSMAAEAAREHDSAVSAESKKLQDEARALLAATKGTDDHGKAHRKAVKEMEDAAKAQDAYNVKYEKWVENTMKGLQAVEETLDPNMKLTDEYNKQSAALQEALYYYRDQPAMVAKLNSEMMNLTETYHENYAAAQEIFKPNKKATRDISDQIIQQEDALKGLTSAQIQYNAKAREAEAMALKAIAHGHSEVDAMADLNLELEKLAKQRDNAEILDIFEQFGGKTAFEKTIEEIGKVKVALEDATDPDIVKGLNTTLGNLRQNELEQIVSTSQQGLRSLQSMATNGSKAFKAMQIAIDALNVVQAVGIIINQGFGDPYTAFARMAAMAAAVAALGVSISGFSGGGVNHNSAEERQKTQGTGSVLGDSTAQSESIAHATQITADATTALVGLNTGMLIALQNLNQALGAAGNQLAHGVNTANFAGPGSPGMNPLDPLGMDPIMGAVGGWLFGGEQSVIDQGIVIAGGKINDMINNIVIGAYQTIHTDGGLFGDSSDSDQIVGVSDQFTHQFELVIGSIVDTVTAAATALGIPLDEINAAIDQFNVAAQHISLEGLSAEDQQKAIEAVFSEIFDGLAGAVVPFIAEFQQVGEGLGETLVRVATEVQVTQEAFKELGIAVDETDPEKFAQIADGLVQAAGGLDKFIAGFQSFVKNFAPAGHDLEIQSASLNSAFAQVGLSLPATRQGLWDLAGGLDLTTAEGQKQLATILKLSDAENDYYKKLEEAQAFLDGLNILPHSEFKKELDDIAQKEQEAVSAANMLAVAQGKEGASTRDLAAIHRWAASQVKQAIAALKASTMDLISQLYGGTPGTLDEVNRRIAAENQFHNDQMNGIHDAAQANADRYAAELDAIKQIKGFLDSLLLGDLSTLTPEQQMLEAQSQYEALLARAQAGDVEAMQQLPQAAQEYLQLAHSFYSSTDDYTSIFEQVTHDLQGIVDHGAGAAPPGGLGSGGSGGSGSSSLEEQQRQLQAEQDAANRQALAAQLAQQLGDYANAIGANVFDLMNQMGVSLTALATDLGIDLDNLGPDIGSQLSLMAEELGVPVTALADQLGLSMADIVTAMGFDITDLSDNTAASIGSIAEQLGLSVPELAAALGISMNDLVSALGIDLSDLNTGTVEALAAMAHDMGISLGDLSDSLGIDLGSLTDVNSPIYQALSDSIGSLPPDQAAALQPYLDAIANATTDADANQAVDDLHAAIIADLPADQADALSPYFNDLVTPDDLTDLDYLSTIADDADDSKGFLRQIEINTRGSHGQEAPRGPEGAQMEVETAVDAAASATYGVVASETNSTMALAASIDALRACMEESDDETRAVLVQRLIALEDTVDESQNRAAITIAKAMAKKATY